MKVAELVGILNFEFDDTELINFEEGIKTATKSLAVIGTAIAGAGVATFAFVQSVAGANDELGKTSELLGISTEDLQGWQHAAELGGGSAESMTSSLENLSKIASEAARGVGGGVEVFGMLGLSATDANGKIKSSTVLMEEVADKMSQLSTQGQKLEFASKLGISADSIIALQQGSEALRKQRNEAIELGFALDKNATKSAADFNDEFLRVSKIITGVSSAVATGLMPEITAMISAFKDWFIANKDVIKQNIQGFLDGLITTFKAMFDIVKRVANVLNAMTQAVGGWKNALVGLGVILTAINIKILLLPILMTALAVAVFLAIEDIVTYFQGGESAIGDFIDQFPILSSVIVSMVAGIATLVSGLAVLKVATMGMTVAMNVFKVAMIAFNLIASINPFSLLIIGIGAVIAGIVLLTNNFDTFIVKVKEIGSSVYKYMVQPFKEAKKLFDDFTSFDVPNPLDAVKGFFGGGNTDINANVLTPQKVSSSSVNSSTTSTNDIKVDINVSGANGDPKVIAETVSNEINKVFIGINSQTQKDMASPIKG